MPNAGGNATEGRIQNQRTGCQLGSGLDPLSARDDGLWPSWSFSPALPDKKGSLGIAACICPVCYVVLMNPLRPCVVVILESSEGKITFQLRDDRPGVGSRDCWGLFGGFIEQDELPAQAAVREIQEELGSSLNPAKLSSIGTAETKTGLQLHIFHYPVTHELDNAVLREGQTYASVSPEEFQDGVIRGRRVVPDHLAVLRLWRDKRPPRR